MASETAWPAQHSVWVRSSHKDARADHLADLVRNVFVVIVMFVVGLIVGYRPSVSVVALLCAVALMLLVSFAFSWIAATIGLAVHSVEAAQSAGFIWLFPLTFASSAFVQTANFPDWLRAFSERQPVTLMVNAVRELLLGQSATTDTLRAVAWSLAKQITLVSAILP